MKINCSDRNIELILPAFFFEIMTDRQAISQQPTNHPSNRRTPGFLMKLHFQERPVYFLIEKLNKIFSCFHRLWQKNIQIVLLKHQGNNIHNNIIDTKI